MLDWKSKVLPVKIGSWEKRCLFISTSGWDRLGLDDEKDDEVGDRCFPRAGALHVLEGRVLGWRKQSHVSWTSYPEKEFV
ncbi:hypothetical protein TNCT_262081 [Trichonephila clavata]|uniref:Uncharacterized protein n=1 Tax=Trichonephila clavata TaxID=2740835 RepID=A0A8X6JEB2_TRICU|nr:hypothetical protein TNCT_262081 [Trichonephila clavata]